MFQTRSTLVSDGLGEIQIILSLLQLDYATEKVARGNAVTRANRGAIEILIRKRLVSETSCLYARTIHAGIIKYSTTIQVEGTFKSQFTDRDPINHKMCRRSNITTGLPTTDGRVFFHIFILSHKRSNHATRGSKLLYIAAGVYSFEFVNGKRVRRKRCRPGAAYSVRHVTLFLLTKQCDNDYSLCVGVDRNFPPSSVQRAYTLLFRTTNNDLFKHRYCILGETLCSRRYA